MPKSRSVSNNDTLVFSTFDIGPLEFTWVQFGLLNQRKNIVQLPSFEPDIEHTLYHLCRAKEPVSDDFSLELAPEFVDCSPEAFSEFGAIRTHGAIKGNRMWRRFP